MITHKLSVLVVEDHSIIAEGLSSILQGSEGLELRGVFSTAEAALLFLGSQPVDVLLLDISLPEMSGIEMCRTVKKQYKKTKIIALTNHTEKSVVQEMLESGADGYLLKNTSRQDLVAAISQVMNNQFIMQSEIQKLLFSPTPAGKALPRLTTREKEILQLVGQGATTSAIARQLFISPQTVETHRRNLMQKFEVNNSAALIKKATEKGLL
ncbi:response regulator [Niabella drilacis]|uniref:Two component transcriptional regulator, LuxR family n=1 Tax=Niabella drilacis (strain DSM 25811 / CCM 8410 / CCUG 62505 / LMG 26954 / E90) TaxID=1285928 RepID=A0A1G6Z637_NIADE|nr:response regulator transcription factor [Niabella drilacis]SDD97991.1 two component transcriptional regulator, LuxR family [Niabella drilacis]